ncbi:MAG TPA: TIM barrel protein [Bryobacteraceae bacterium]|nr:TIM barrel protein [Bryobacteraceae bacterium]
MTRRTFIPSTGLGAAAVLAGQEKTIQRKGRLKQSVCRWCYQKIPIEDLAREAARLGLVAMDLVPQSEWEPVRKNGLRLTVVPGPTTIPDGLNRKENHDQIETKMKTMIADAKTAGAHSIIVFSGNRRGMSDEEGLDNTVLGLNRLTKMAEDTGVLIVMELLNSKVNHKDYMCDHTPWGVEAIKRVNSPMVRLLYDIYHMQIMEGDVIRTIRDNHQYIAHYHTGGVPGRNEIDQSQELYYPAIAEAIVETGYKGYFAHEYIPKRLEPIKSLAQGVDLCDV